MLRSSNAWSPRNFRTGIADLREKDPPVRYPPPLDQRIVAAHLMMA